MASDHDARTARIDRTLDRRKPETNDQHFTQWEKQFRPRWNPTTWATAAEERHEDAMRAARGLPPLPRRLPSWAYTEMEQEREALAARLGRTPRRS